MQVEDWRDYIRRSQAARANPALAEALILEAERAMSPPSPREGQVSVQGDGESEA
jgi:hypothetical protein